MRILAVDNGAKWIGLAVSDELGISVKPLQTIRARGIKRDASRISEIARELRVDQIVVGLPLNMDGSPSDSAVRATTLATELHRLTGTPVVTWDERLSSFAAIELLQERGEKPTKTRIDQIAACLILQDYLIARPQRKG